jgi:hypothetical protein
LVPEATPHRPRRSAGASLDNHNAPIYRANVKGERPYMTFQPEKSKDAIAIYAATRGSGSPGALKFFERLTSELNTPAAHDRSPSAELMILAYHL